MEEVTKRPRIKVYGNSSVGEYVPPIPSKKDAKDIVELISKMIVIISAISFFSGLIYGLFLANFYYSLYEIPFLELADAEDYIRASLSQIHYIFPLVFGTSVAFIWVGNTKKKLRTFLFDKNYFVQRLAILCLVIFVPIILIFHMPSSFSMEGNSKQDTQEKWRLNTISGGKSAYSVKAGHNGVLSIEYGKDLRELSCLALISEVGSMTYFWSISTDSLIAINTSQLISIKTQLREKPQNNDSATSTKGYRGEESFLASEFGKKAMKWEKEKSQLCG